MLVVIPTTNTSTTILGNIINSERMLVLFPNEKIVHIVAECRKLVNKIEASMLLMWIVLLVAKSGHWQLLLQSRVS